MGTHAIEQFVQQLFINFLVVVVAGITIIIIAAGTTTNDGFVHPPLIILNYFICQYYQFFWSIIKLNFLHDWCWDVQLERIIILKIIFIDKVL
jgi:hypothetical protein